MSGSQIEAPISAGNRRFLRYWAVNVSIVYAGGWSWIPGFPYKEEEKSRLAAIAASVPGAAVTVWLAAATIFFFLVLIVLVVGVMVPLITLLWPDPANMSATGFVSILALLMLVSIGWVMPLSIALGGAVADYLAGDPPPPDLPGDAALCAKIHHQFWRLCAIIATIFIPGFLIFLSFDINPGVLLIFTRILTAASILLGLISHLQARRAKGG
jgi:hypothetical protein